MEPSLTQRRFRTAAKYYLSGRSEYASLLIRRVVELCALDPTQRILDLGCGPGQLAMAFAPFVREVTALDPEPEMLEIARRNAASGHLNIHFVQAGSGDLRSVTLPSRGGANEELQAGRQVRLLLYQKVWRYPSELAVF